MRTLRQIFYLAVSLFSFGCGPSAGYRAVESKAQALVTRRASTNEVAHAYGGGPMHIYTKAKALEYFTKQPDEQWRQVAKYPLTYEYRSEVEFTFVLISFDDEGRAAAYYLNVQ